MLITEEMYTLVRINTKKIVRCPQKREEVYQESCIKLHKSNAVVETLKPFIYKVVLHEFLAIYKRDRVRSIREDVWVNELTEHYFTPNFEVSIDLERTILKLLKETKCRPKLHQVLKAVLSDPTPRIIETARDLNINKNTFKANIMHLRRFAKKRGITYA